MKDMQRTVIFAVVAAVSITVAVGTRYATKPKSLADFEKVGKPFYPEFEDPTEATSLRVAAFNEETATIKEFKVELKDGRWIIPSHHNYPADAQDRIQKTAASVIGINRAALATRQKSQYEEFGVIDPLTEDAGALTGRGQRITLTTQDGSVLADYIIGKEVENRAGQYYIRRADEKETYRVELNIDLSTKLSDWIEDDLLKIDRNKLTEIVVDKYSISEPRPGQPPAKVDQEISRLTRDESFDPWKLDGLDEEAEEIDEDNIREMVNSLDDLKIVGVRPKPRGIRGDLSLERRMSPEAVQILVFELQSKGFVVSLDDQNNNILLSNDGELAAATNDGAVYTLRFGKIFTGSESEIEIGFTEKKRDGEKKKKDSKNGKNQKKNGKSGDDADAEDDSDDDEGLKKSRYLFVYVSFDEKYIPDKPVKPVEPKQPAGPPAPGDSGAAPDKNNNKDSDRNNKPGGGAGKSDDGARADDADGDAAEKASDDKSKSNGDDEKPKPDSEKKPDDDKDKPDTEDKPEEPKKDPLEEYKAAKQKYDDELQKYESDLETYNQKIEDGKKKVAELNERFAAWYYVISAESFEDLRLARKDLVKLKEKEDESVDTEQPVEAKKPESEKPAEAKKPTPVKKDEADPKPATAKKPTPQENPKSKKNDG